MKTVKLNNGVEMPILGFGVFQVDDLDVCEQAVTDAINAGYRLFDAAHIYGNEEAVGRAIKKSGIPRNQFFITSKMWVTETTGDKPAKAIDETLRKLGTDYLDLYLLHMPFGDTFNAWRAMEKAYHEGKVRAIGVSSFMPDIYTNFINFNEVKPAVNQMEINPLDQQRDVVKFYKDLDVQPEAFSPLAEGLHDIFNNSVLTKIAQNHDKSTGQVMLRWLTQQGIVAIPKSVHKNRINENFDSLDFNLSDEEMASIKPLDLGKGLLWSPRNPTDINSIVGSGRPDSLK